VTAVLTAPSPAGDRVAAVGIASRGTHDSHESYVSGGHRGLPDDGFVSTRQAPNPRRVKLIERQRDRCGSEAVTDARTNQRWGVTHPFIAAVATLRTAASDRR
jgi:hypothetical protein